VAPRSRANVLLLPSMWLGKGAQHQASTWGWSSWSATPMHAGTCHWVAAPPLSLSLKQLPSCCFSCSQNLLSKRGGWSAPQPVRSRLCLLPSLLHSPITPVCTNAVPPTTDMESCKGSGGCVGMYGALSHAAPFYIILILNPNQVQLTS